MLLSTCDSIDTLRAASKDNDNTLMDLISVATKTRGLIAPNALIEKRHKKLSAAARAVGAETADEREENLNKLLEFAIDEMKADKK